MERGGAGDADLRHRIERFTNAAPTLSICPSIRVHRRGMGGMC